MVRPGWLSTLLVSAVSVPGIGIVASSASPAPAAYPEPKPAAFPVPVQAGHAALPPAQRHHIPHTFLIEFRDDSSQEARDEHITWIRSLESTENDIEFHERERRRQETQDDMTAKNEWNNQKVSDSTDGAGLVVIRHVFQSLIQGYSAVIMNDKVLDKIRARGEVAKIERVGITEPLGLPVSQLKDMQTMRPPAVLMADQFPEETSYTADPITGGSAGIAIVQNRGWNTVRISHRNFTKGYDAGPWVRDKNLGKGTKVYVLDTGLNLAQPGFKGSQVTFGANLVGWKNILAKTNDQDNHGHGTMCAGVIAGSRYGISPEAHTVAVKIADDNNRSACDDVYAGIEWVLNQPGSNNMKVISMSHYGFTGKPDVSTAVAKAVERGVHFVVCAGNDGRDACLVQPSNAKGVVSVGSVNGYNKFPVKGTIDAVAGLQGKEAESTNVGACVSVFAPGTKVPTLSAKNLDPNYKYFSWGTSIAAPQVAAIIANRLSAVGPQTPAQIREWIKKTATPGQVDEKDLKGSPNLILFSGILEDSSIRSKGVAKGAT